jgi:hypothetical protein
MPAMWIIAALCLLFLTLDRLPALIDYLKDVMGLSNIHKVPLIEGPIG